MKKCYITVDVEQDCPPRLRTMYGIKGGLPKLLKIFEEKGVKATFLVTGAAAELHPGSIENILGDGHELGCHGYAHERFDRISPEETGVLIGKAAAILRSFDRNIISFRAPNLNFPVKYLGLLEELGFMIDSSLAGYKPPFPRRSLKIGRVIRVPVSVTSSFLRLPLSLALPVIERLKSPVIFVHPWEFTNMSGRPVRFDCRFNTGDGALRNLSEIIHHLKTKGYTFLPLREIIS